MRNSSSTKYWNANLNLIQTKTYTFRPKFQVFHLFLRWIKTEQHFVASILHFVRKGDHSSYDFRLWVLIPPQNMMVSPFVLKLHHIYHSRH